MLLEVAETGCFEWKLSTSKKIRCFDDTLEELRQQYNVFLSTQNLENNTIDLYDYAFRCLIEGVGVTNVSGLYELHPSHIQSMLLYLSERLCLNSQGTVFPIIRQTLSYLYAAEFVLTDFSGMVLTPTYQNMHLRPYITASGEEKLFHVERSSSPHKNHDALGNPPGITRY